jgi:FAD/FMN-containing dehydrogenase
MILTIRVNANTMPASNSDLIGHLADGNLHVNGQHDLAPDHRTVRGDRRPSSTRGLAARGGSYSAEHGIGLEKKCHAGALDPFATEPAPDAQASSA